MNDSIWMKRNLCSFCLLVGLIPLSSGWSSSPCIIGPQHATRRVSSSLSAHTDDDQSNDESLLPEDKKRRSLLAQSSALLAGLAFRSQAANAEGVDSKIVLQTSAENAPVKYVDATVTATRTPVVTTKADTLCLDSEERRINVFERTAPSVVFIDTFKEQRDVFSTNV